MTPPPADAPRKRWWPSRRLWASVGVLAVLAIASPYLIHFWEEWQIDRDLAAAIAETDRLDPGWRIEEMRAKQEAVPDAENVANAIRKINRLIGDKLYSPEFNNLGIPAGVEPKSFELGEWIWSIDESFDQIPAAAVLNEQQIRALEGELKEHTQAVQEARKLREFSKCLLSSKTQSERIADERALYSAARLLRFDVLMRCELEDLRGALESIEALQAIAQFEKDEANYLLVWMRPIALESACRCTQRVLAQGIADGNRLADIQARFLKEENVNAFLSQVRAGRAQQDKSYRTLEEENNPEVRKQMIRFWAKDWHKDSEPKERPRYLKWFLKERTADPRILQTLELRQFNRMFEFAKKPIAEQFRGFDAFMRSDEGGDIQRRPQNVGERVFRTHTTIATTRTAIALERYRQKHGDWPKSLDLLAPEFMNEVPTDLYVGKPLVYRRVERGVIVYSVGLDRKDDGGKFRWERGVVEAGMEGLDIGVRLWDPEHRRQPPLPPVVPRQP